MLSLPVVNKVILFSIHCSSESGSSIAGGSNNTEENEYCRQASSFTTEQCV